jgi:hypothetical protein
LFGDLKNGGWLTITVENDKILLVPKGKVTKVPLLTVEPTTENVIQD